LATTIQKQTLESSDDVALADRLKTGHDQIITELRKLIVGQENVIELVLLSLFTGGNSLIVGVPGLAKTLLISTIAQVLDLKFSRIQFTPDLMPSDIIGTELLEEDHGTGKRFFKFQRGPVFTNLLLADELNRTPPKTQSALLEAMQERTISYAGTTHALPSPFFVLATQNPLEQAGTYPLPEAQLDRFLLHIRVDYPSETEERAILAQTTGGADARIGAVMSGDDVLALQKLVRDAHLGDDLLTWITRLVRASRPQETSLAEIREWVRWGAGPRAGQALVLAAKARALIHGRYAATREDVTRLAAPVLRHRVLLSFAAEAEQRSADDVVGALLRGVPYPA
jgi:MoxR-like ATPase